MATRSGAMSASAWAWSLYQGARDPYIILVGTYVFIPYFATAVVGDAVAGQSLVAAYSLISNVLVAFTAPFLGAAVDQLGSRRPWLLGLSLITAPLIAALWLVTPAGVPGVGVLPTLGILITISLLLSYGDVLHNAMLMTAATVDEQPAASGWALSLGAATSIVLLLGVLIAFALPGQPGFAWLPAAPMMGLDPATHEQERIVGPIVAVVFVVLTAPMFLFARDAAPTGLSFTRAISVGTSQFLRLFREARAPRDVIIFLAARMLYINGKMALLVFGGVYAAGVMGWDGLKLLILGIIATLAGVCGGIMAGWLDPAIGPREAFKVEIAVTLGALLVQIGTTPKTIAFFWPVTAEGSVVTNFLVFQTAPELVYLACSLVISLFGTASWASSRTVMARLSPLSEAGAYFGLFTFSQTATMWVGPLLIDAFTRHFQSQPAGFIPIALMMLAGLAMLFFVRGGGKALG